MTVAQHWCPRSSVTSSTTGVSSIYYLQSNCRAELAVKAARRIIADCTDPAGSVDLDLCSNATLPWHTLMSLPPSYYLAVSCATTSPSLRAYCTSTQSGCTSQSVEREAAFTERNVQLLTRHDASSKMLPTLCK